MEKEEALDTHSMFTLNEIVTQSNAADLSLCPCRRHVSRPFSRGRVFISRPTMFGSIGFIFVPCCHSAVYNLFILIILPALPQTPSLAPVLLEVEVK